MGEQQNFVIPAPRRTFTEGDIRAWYDRLSQQRATIEQLARQLEIDEGTLREQARAAGHGALLRELESPPPPPPAEPRARYRVVKPYRHFRQGRHGPEEYSSDVGGIVALPGTVAKALGDRIIEVPSSTEIRGVPLRHDTVVD